MFAAQQCTATYASAMVATLLVLFMRIITDAAPCCMLVVRVVPKVQTKRVLHGHRLLLLCMHQHGGSFLGVHVSSTADAAGGGKIAEDATN
jgi:hypothetical protein